MASGSTAGRGGKGFDFGSDDILCSYEDYGNHQRVQDSSNGLSNHTDPPKDFHKNRISRSSVFPYGPPEDSFNHEVIVVVERTMKTHTDNLMRFLEGISSRLSQLELYCYNLDKSIGEMKNDLLRDHGEADNKLKSLEKHVQEVHRSVQILRDKQELADTQKELAKLQMAQKESTHLSSNEDKSKPVAADVKKADQQGEAPNQQLALALPHQVVPQHQPPAQPSPTQSQTVSPPQPYYTSPVQTQQPQPHYLPADTQFRASQVQEINRMPSQPVQSSVSQAPSGQQYTQYQQQWPQQVSPPQPSPIQPQVRPPSTTVYTAYLPPGQSPVQPPESVSNSTSMPVTYAVPVHGDVSNFAYGAGRPILQQSPMPQVKNTYMAQQGDGYAAGGSHLIPGSAYVIYDGESGRHHQPQPTSFQQAVYAPTSLPLQKPQSGPPNPNPSAYIRNHPYSDLIEKMVNMGFRGDHVVSVIQRLEESGQPVDFHAVLDRLNVHSSGGSQRGWSG